MAILAILIDPDDGDTDRMIFDDLDAMWENIEAMGFDMYTTDDEKKQLLDTGFVPGEDHQNQLLVVDLSNPYRWYGR